MPPAPSAVSGVPIPAGPGGRVTMVAPEPGLSACVRSPSKDRAEVERSTVRAPRRSGCPRPRRDQDRVDRGDAPSNSPRRRAPEPRVAERARHRGDRGRDRAGGAGGRDRGGRRAGRRAAAEHVGRAVALVRVMVDWIPPATVPLITAVERQRHGESTDQVRSASAPPLAEPRGSEWGRRPERQRGFVRPAASPPRRASGSGAR